MARIVFFMISSVGDLIGEPKVKQYLGELKAGREDGEDVNMESLMKLKQ